MFDSIKTNNTNIPKTIEELKQWANDKNLPLFEMRTFIGENINEPKVYGIYKDDISGDFIVYKNKADGKRAIRYQGKDEAYAVKQLYEKMRQRLKNQSGYHKSVSVEVKGNGIKWSKLIIIAATIITLTAGGLIFMVSKTISDRKNTPHTGYYHHDDDYYYYYHNTWYIWDDSDWGYAYSDYDWMKDDYKDYYIGNSYDNNTCYDDFTDSSYYDYESDDDWDSDYSWDDDSSWDSSFDDWDSDW